MAHEVKSEITRRPGKTAIIAPPVVDGCVIPFCGSIDFVDEEIQKLKFSPDELVVYSGIHECDFGEYAKIACIILREELMKDSALYKGFKASIKSAIKEAPNYTSESELAERILDRLIGVN